MHGVTLSHFMNRFHQTGFESAHIQGAVWVHGSTAGGHHVRPSDLGEQQEEQLQPPSLQPSAAGLLSGPPCALRAGLLPSIHGTDASSLISPGIGAC